MKEINYQNIKEKNINIKQNEFDLNINQITQIAKLYAEVFRGSPWNEAVKCSIDGQFKGEEISIGSKCDCGGTYIEAYPLDETINYIKNENQKPGFICSLVTSDSNQEIIGFAWSYTTTPEKLINEKWFDVKNKQEIMEVLQNNGLPYGQKFQYLCEAGIKPEYRGFGLANLLVSQISGSGINLSRTNINTPIMTVSSNLGFQQIMGPEVIIDRSNKITIPTGKIINRLDTEREDRVLFIKK